MPGSGHGGNGGEKRRPTRRRIRLGTIGVTELFLKYGFGKGKKTPLKRGEEETLQINNLRFLFSGASPASRGHGKKQNKREERELCTGWEKNTMGEERRVILGMVEKRELYAHEQRNEFHGGGGGGGGGGWGGGGGLLGGGGGGGGVGVGVCGGGVGGLGGGGGVVLLLGGGGVGGGGGGGWVVGGGGGGGGFLGGGGCVVGGGGGGDLGGWEKGEGVTGGDRRAEKWGNPYSTSVTMRDRSHRKEKKRDRGGSHVYHRKGEITGTVDRAKGYIESELFVGFRKSGGKN